MSNDFFAHKAESYEQADYRVDNVERIARSICSRVSLDANMKIMDFGSGTGLLLEKIAPSVSSITAVDISKSMMEQLRKKRASLSCDLELIEMDLTCANLDRKFDGIISSMTMHHVEDIKAMFDKFLTMLNNNGFIAIADLVTEDGSFHSEDTGVFHFGFEPNYLAEIAAAAGFENIEVSSVSAVNKPEGDYPVLLLTATKS